MVGIPTSMGANGTSRFENQLMGTCQDNNQLNTAFSLQPVQVTNRCNAHDLLAAFGVRRRAQPPGLDPDAHVARRVQSRRWPTIEASKALPAQSCAASGPEDELYRPLPPQSEIQAGCNFHFQLNIRILVNSLLPPACLAQQDAYFKESTTTKGTSRCEQQ